MKNFFGSLNALTRLDKFIQFVYLFLPSPRPSHLDHHAITPFIKSTRFTPTKNSVTWQAINQLHKSFHLNHLSPFK